MVDSNELEADGYTVMVMTKKGMQAVNMSKRLHVVSEREFPDLIVFINSAQLKIFYPTSFTLESNMIMMLHLYDDYEA